MTSQVVLVARSLVIGLASGLMVFLCYGMLSIVSRLRRARANLPPRRRRLGAVTLYAILLSAALYLRFPTEWVRIAAGVDLACFALAALLLPVAAVLATPLRLPSDPRSRRRLGWAALALLATAVVASLLWTRHRVGVQRTLDDEVARATAEQRQFADVLERDREMLELRARLGTLIAEGSALHAGKEPPAPAPAHIPWTPGVPGPPTWNPLEQGRAISDRRYILEWTRAQTERGRHLNGWSARIDEEIAAMQASVDELEPMVREMRMRREQGGAPAAAQ